jgi:FAD/FMN-containing dehydrogenase
VLLVELDGRPVAVAAEEQVVTDLLQRHGATEIRGASTPAERARLWQGRKKAFGAMGRMTRDLIVQDAVVPRSRLPEILDRIAAIAAHHQVTVVNVFHAGDGNLHPNICYDRTDVALMERVEHVSREIMEACVAAGGSITGEHGVGTDKMKYMPLMFDTVTMELMCDVRSAFDRDGRANPGKVVPVRSCREWRAGGVA